MVRSGYGGHGLCGGLPTWCRRLLCGGRQGAEPGIGALVILFERPSGDRDRTDDDIAAPDQPSGPAGHDGGSRHVDYLRDLVKQQGRIKQQTRSGVCRRTRAWASQLFSLSSPSRSPASRSADSPSASTSRAGPRCRSRAAAVPTRSASHKLKTSTARPSDTTPNRSSWSAAAVRPPCRSAPRRCRTRTPTACGCPRRPGCRRC